MFRKQLPAKCKQTEQLGNWAIFDPCFNCIAPKVESFMEDLSCLDVALTDKNNTFYFSVKK